MKNFKMGQNVSCQGVRLGNICGTDRKGRILVEVAASSMQKTIDLLDQTNAWYSYLMATKPGDPSTFYFHEEDLEAAKPLS